jgi:hypothetical protein
MSVCPSVYISSHPYNHLHDYTGWFKALVQYLRRLSGRSFGIENVNNDFFGFATVFKWRRLHVDVAAYYCDHLTEVTRCEFVQVQIIKAQLSDSDGSTGNKSDKSPTRTGKYSKRSNSEVTTEKCYKGQNLPCRIWGSHGGEYEDCCLLGCSAV